jgi:hypothetical protein
MEISTNVNLYNLTWMMIDPINFYRKKKKGSVKLFFCWNSATILHYYYKRSCSHIPISVYSYFPVLEQESFIVVSCIIGYCTTAAVLVGRP